MRINGLKTKTWKVTKMYPVDTFKNGKLIDLQFLLYINFKNETIIGC